MPTIGSTKPVKSLKTSKLNAQTRKWESGLIGQTGRLIARVVSAELTENELATLLFVKETALKFDHAREE